MFRVRDGVKFGANRVCPKCNSGPVGAVMSPISAVRSGWSPNTGPPAVARFKVAQRGPTPMSAFEEHKEELEHYEQMFGRERGRLAVSLDRLTNALVLVGQHGVYCTSQRNPTVPAMDIRIIANELSSAKELVQSVMEELRRTKNDAQT